MHTTKDTEVIIDLQDYLIQHILPVKYAYTLSAASFHTKYANSQGYQATVEINKEEYGILIKHLKSGSFDYCEIGADDGAISLQILDYLNKNDIHFGNHNFIDFSKELLEKCQKNINKEQPHLKCSFLQCDIEQPNLKIPIDSTNNKIIFFIGNTLGNVESENIVLQNIYNIMNENDFFLVGLTFWNDSFDELSSYNTALFRESVLEYLRILGINTVPQNYTLKYDHENHTVFCNYKLSSDFNYGKARFLTGDCIRCFQSRRYSLEYCENMFKSNKFNIVAKKLDKESRHAIFLLNKI